MVGGGCEAVSFDALPCRLFPVGPSAERVVVFETADAEAVAAAAPAPVDGECRLANDSFPLLYERDVDRVETTKFVERSRRQSHCLFRRARLWIWIEGVQPSEKRTIERLQRRIRDAPFSFCSTLFSGPDLSRKKRTTTALVEDD